MKKTSRAKKIIIGMVIVIISILAILGVIHLVLSNTFVFEYSDGFTVGLNIYDLASYDADEMEELEKKGEYVMKYPRFENSTFHIGRFWGFGSYEKNAAVYTEMNSIIIDYINEIGKKYNYYAKLDYTVEVVPNKTVTVNFTGTGYYYDDRDPESLDKTFIFNIKNASEKNPPKLIEEFAP